MKFIHAFSLLTLVVLLLSGASVPVYAQCVGMGCDGPIREVYLICCNEPVYNAGEEGVGTDHSKDCRDYVRNRASAETRRSMCNQINSRGQVCPDAAGACNSPNGKYCGDNMPDKGFVYGTAPGGRVHSEPSSNSPTSANVPVGIRLLYAKSTKTPDGQTWYYVRLPGASEGWVPGSNVACTRPTPPPTPRPSKFFPTTIPLSGTSAAQAGSRG